MLVIDKTDDVVDVKGFLPEIDKIADIPIVQMATAYDHETEGTLILIFNQPLYFGEKMKHSIINPNQLQANYLIVADVLKHLSYDDQSKHARTIPDLDLVLPLKLDGVISYLDTRLPSLDEAHSCTLA